MQVFVNYFSIIQQNDNKITFLIRFFWIPFGIFISNGFWKASFLRSNAKKYSLCKNNYEKYIMKFA